MRLSAFAAGAALAAGLTLAPVLTAAPASATTPITFTYQNCGEAAPGNNARCIQDWTGGAAPFTASWTATGSGWITSTSTSPLDSSGTWESIASGPCTYKQWVTYTLTVTDASNQTAQMQRRIYCGVSDI